MSRPSRSVEQSRTLDADASMKWYRRFTGARSQETAMLKCPRWLMLHGRHLAGGRNTWRASVKREIGTGCAALRPQYIAERV